MKRSEMQVLICKLLEEQSLQGTAYMFKAQQILELIEKKGMLPPSFYRPHDWNKRGITYEQWLTEPSKIREWETEDETK